MIKTTGKGIKFGMTGTWVPVHLISNKGNVMYLSKEEQAEYYSALQALHANEPPSKTPYDELKAMLYIHE